MKVIKLDSISKYRQKKQIMRMVYQSHGLLWVFLKKGTRFKVTFNLGLMEGSNKNFGALFIIFASLRLQEIENHHPEKQFQLE